MLERVPVPGILPRITHAKPFDCARGIFITNKKTSVSSRRSGLMLERVPVPGILPRITHAKPFDCAQSIFSHNKKTRREDGFLRFYQKFY
jgi:hypothetical protein